MTGIIEAIIEAWRSRFVRRNRAASGPFKPTVGLSGAVLAVGFGNAIYRYLSFGRASVAERRQSLAGAVSPRTNFARSAFHSAEGAVLHLFRE